MQFMTFYSPAHRPPPGTMPDPKHIEAIGKLMADWMAKGILVGSGAFGMAAKGYRVTASSGDYTVRDGAEHAVVAAVNGFAIIQGETKEDILNATKTFLSVVGDGTVDVIPLAGPPPRN